MLPRSSHILRHRPIERVRLRHTGCGKWELHFFLLPRVLSAHVEKPLFATAGGDCGMKKEEVSRAPVGVGGLDYTWWQPKLSLHFSRSTSRGDVSGLWNGWPVGSMC
jgi:hypothetical protein